jgi:subtilase family serine protease
MFRHPFHSTILLAALFVSHAYPQNVNSTPKRALITQAVDNQKRVTLFGNTRASANAANDRGRVVDSLPLEHMLLQLQRPPELEQALEQYMADLQDPNSPGFHQWLTAAQFGEKFGLAQSDLDVITNWLESQGFLVNRIYLNKMTVDFSGTAGQVARAFQTEIHNLEVKGERHIANMGNPQIPAALAPAVVGITSLNDFRPHVMKRDRPKYTINSYFGSTESVAPGDLTTIYNLNPLFAKGITGKGQTIVVIEDTNVYSTADWSTFRSTFGLSGYSSGSFTQVHPDNCSNPGVVAGNDAEAILDAEWASAAAPNAAIELASCSDTTTTFGGLLALQNLLNTGTPPALVSISYGECEAENGAAANATYFSAYQQAAVEGVSVFVAAGDEGAASCDAGNSYASDGVSVSAFASTPYNVAVGGTDFGDTYAGTNSTYWNSTNTSTFESAKSYVPEIPWNDSCAGTLLASYFGYSQSWGPSGFCNSFYAYLLSAVVVAGGSGGPSACATGSPSVSGVVSGSCKGYAKPSWQAGLFGNPNDGVRDIPDVSLFASDGPDWGHYYIFCWSDTANGGSSCSGDPSTWSGAGGTSFASPIMAGIQALINQNTGSRWGNPAPNYYKLAAAEYGSAGNSSCLSSGTPKSSCVFYDITQGDMDMPCASVDCYGSSGSGSSVVLGVLSTSSSSLLPAYGTANGWDFATGIGSVNAYNLATNWTSISSAQYVGLDTATQGAWTGKYGSNGELIANDLSDPPSFSAVTFTADSLYTWAASTTDVRALQTSSGASTRTATCYYSHGSSSFNINLNLADGNPHRIALYLVDWDSTVRTQTISIMDANTHAVLNTQSYAGFHNGEYAVWNIKGNVVIQVTHTAGGANAVVSGIFVD